MLLPCADSEPSLLRIDPPVGHLTKQDRRSVNHPIWKAIDHLMKLSPDYGFILPCRLTE